MLNNPDRRRSRESPEELNPPSKIQATSSRPRPLSLSQPSFSSSSSARSPPTASTNYHSLINRFISFLPQSSSRGELTSSSDRLSPSISNHEGTSSILVPLYAALKYSPPPLPKLETGWVKKVDEKINGTIVLYVTSMASYIRNRALFSTPLFVTTTFSSRTTYALTPKPKIHLHSHDRSPNAYTLTLPYPYCPPN